MGDIDRCRELLAVQGNDVNATDSSSQHATALHAAAAGGHINVCELLLKNGANVNALQTVSLVEIFMHGTYSS